MANGPIPEFATFGEGLLRLGVSPGERLEDVAHLSVAVGGAEANVAAAVARMGKRAAWISRLPSSALGRRVAGELARQGVDVSQVMWVPEGRVGSYYYEPSVPPRPGNVIYDRADSTICSLTVDEMPWQFLTSAKLVHLTGITPALSPSLASVAVETARRVQVNGGRLSVDVNYRARLWPVEIARTVLIEVCTGADIVIVAERDARGVFEFSGSTEVVAVDLQELLMASTVIVTRGEKGSVWRIDSVAGATPAIASQQLDRIGAGDAFAAGVILGALDGDTELGIRMGTAMAALTLGWHGDQFRGTREQVEEVLAGRRDGLDR